MTLGSTPSRAHLISAEYATTAPLKKQEAPLMLVIMWAMLPPVQDSAVDRVFPVGLSSSLILLAVSFDIVFDVVFEKLYYPAYK